jgi:hypothetical protein
MKTEGALLSTALWLGACGAPDDGAPQAGGCGLHTAYAGDEFCLPAPTDEADSQIHFGPESYDDPDNVAPYLIAPGEDHLYCVDEKLDTSVRYISGYTAAVRPGNHHLTLFARGTGTPDFTFKQCANLPGTAVLPIKHDGALHEIGTGPEYSGGAVQVPLAITSWLLDVHYLNTGTAPILMEGWINLKSSEKPRVVLGLFQFSGGTQMSVPPGATKVVTIPATSCPLPSDVSIVSLGAHQHSHGTRESVSIQAGTTKTLVYENYDWEHPFGALFNSSTENASLDRAAKTSGAVSGVLHVPKSNGITWECEIDNTLGSTIRYGLDIAANEMCAIAGLYVPPRSDGRSWGCTAQ